MNLRPLLMTLRPLPAICVLLVHTHTAPAQSMAQATKRLTLDTAVRLAVNHNVQLEAARLQIEQAEAHVASIRTRRLPSFKAEVTASQLLTPVDFAFPQGAFGTFPGTGAVPTTDTNVSVDRQPTAYVSTEVSQPLSQLFTIGLNVRSALAARDLEIERARSARLSLINAVKRAYFAVVQTKSALAASTEALALYRELDRTLSVRVAQKVALKSDSLDVQFRLAQEELAYTTYGNALATQKEQLNRLLGRDVTTPFDVEAEEAIALVDVDLSAARARATAQRPEIREARLMVTQAEVEQRIAKASRIPDVSLAVSYMSNFNMDVLPANLATAGIRVSWEPFDWGRRRLEVTSKTHSVAQARLALRDAEDKAAVEINSRFRTLSEKRALLRVAAMAQDTAREKLRVKTHQFQVQTALLPDVLQVRAEVAQATDRYQQALVQFWTAKADFELAMGEE